MRDYETSRDKHTGKPTKEKAINPNKFRTPDSTNWWDIRKGKEFCQTKSYRSEPDLMADNFKSFILTFRPSKTAKAYQKIWMKQQDMLPIKILYDKANNKSKKENEEQVHENKLRNAIRKSFDDKRLSELKNKGCQGNDRTSSIPSCH